MPLDPIDRITLMRYLTGELTGPEREAITDRLAQDDAFLLSLEEFETEWIDRLARGELVPAEAEQVRQYLRETGQEERLAFAGALAGATASDAEPRGQEARVLPISSHRPRFASLRFWAAGAIAAALLLGAVAVNRLWRDATAPPVEEIAGRRNGELAQPSAVIAVTLPAGITRGGASTTRVDLTTSARQMELRLEIPEGRDFPRYRVALLGQDDQVDWEQAGVESTGGFVVMTIPLATIGAGTREFALFGVAGGGPETLLAYYNLTLRPARASQP